MARVLYSGVNEYGQPSEVMLGCAIGDIIPHFGSTPPPGTLVCDGSEVSREAYAELYEEIGALVGQGDGSTTFNLPDLRGKWMMGADEERRAGTEIAEGLPNIKGEFHALFNDGTGALIFTQQLVGGAFYLTNSKVQIPSNLYLSRANAAISTGVGIVTDEDSGNTVVLDCSRVSAIYEDNAHVQPASVAVLPCIVYE